MDLEKTNDTVEKVDSAPNDASKKISERPGEIRTRNRKKAFVAVAALGIILTICLALVKQISSNDKQYLQKTATDEKSIEQEAVDDQVTTQPADEVPIPKALFESSRSVSGVSVGYVKKTEETSSSLRSYFFPKVNALEDNYETTLFYASGGEVFSYNTITEEMVQYSNNGGPEMSGGGFLVLSDPIFSSVSQSLAFESGNKMVVKNIETGNEVIVDEGLRQHGNIRPVSWSPDGTKLWVTVDSGADPGTDEYAIGRAAYYSTADQLLHYVELPDGFNNGGGSAEWLDNETVLTGFATKTNFGSFTQEGWFELSIIDGATTQVEQEFDDLTLVTYAGDEVFFVEERTLYKKPIENDGSEKQSLVSATEEYGSINYILLQDEESEQARDVFFSVGEAGSESSIDFKQLNLTDNKVTDLFTPGGYSSFIVGWKEDYSAFFYRVYLSATSEIRMFDLATQEEKTLVDNMPW